MHDGPNRIYYRYILATYIEKAPNRNSIPGGLKTRKSTGTNCQVEIHFSLQIIKFLMKHNLLCW